MALTRPRAAQIFNLDYKQATRVVTTTNITLTGGAPAAVDSVSLSVNDRVLVTGQSTGTQNGLYYVSVLGSGSDGTWSRTSDGNETGEIEAGMIVMVTEGSTYADSQWKLITDDPIIINTTALTFTQNYMANSISGGTSNVVVNSNANVTISSAGTANVLTVSSTGMVVTGNIVPTANATYNLGSATNVWNSLYVANNSIYIGNVTIGATSNTLTINSANVVTADASGNTSTVGNIIGGNILTSGLISATGNITAGNLLISGAIIDSAQLDIQTSAANANIVFTPNGTGNVNTGANVSATGNVTANYFIGNGSALTNIVASSINANSLTGTVLNSGVVTSSLTSVGVLTSLSVSGNVTVGNVSATNHTGTDVSVTGTVTGASVVGGVITGSSASVSGTVTGASVAGGVITGSSASVTGTQTAASTVGGVITGSSTSVTGNVTGNYILGNGSQLTGLPATYSNTNVSSLLAAFGSNTISTTGTITAGNITGGNLILSGAITDTGQLDISTTASNGNIVLTPNGTGNVNTGANVSVTGRVTAASTVGGVITGSSVSVTGTQTAASTVGGVITGSSASVTGIVTGASVVGGVITGSSVSVTGTQTAASTVGGVITGSSASVTGNITTTANISGGFILGNGSALTGIAASGGSSITNGTSNVTVASGANTTVGVAGTTVATFASTGLILPGILSATGNITGGNLIQGGIRVFKWTTSETAPTGAVPGDQWFIASTGKRYEYWNDGTGNAWVDQSQSTSFDALAVSGAATITGALTAGSVATAGITNTGGNGVGNIGNATGYFNTIFAKATSAQYADLAETYTADIEYPSGTVVIFGGQQEITVSNVSHDTRIAGVVSTEPAYLMNSGAQGLPVALTGRVPCQVRGPVQKGDILVNVESGTAGRLDPSKATWGCVLGKSLENYSGNNVVTIEVAVGRF